MKFNLFNKTEDLKVEFFTEYEGLADIPECQPQPAYKFFPEWFKKVQRFRDKDDLSDKGTIKNCPVFAEYLTQGFIIPMWCDTKITITEEYWQVDTSAKEMHWELHGDHQYLDFIPPQEKKYTTLKAVCPWHVKTPKGYSLYQKNLDYHYFDWSIMPGVINTDYHCDINQQVIIEKPSEIFIPRGTPFVWYIPYKRSNYQHEVREANKEDKKFIRASQLDIFSKFNGSYKLRKKKIDNER